MRGREGGGEGRDGGSVWVWGWGGTGNSSLFSYTGEANNNITVKYNFTLTHCNMYMYAPNRALRSTVMKLLLMAGTVWWEGRRDGWVITTLLCMRGL